jgi:hypothetical protein
MLLNGVGVILNKRNFHMAQLITVFKVRNMVRKLMEIDSDSFSPKVIKNLSLAALAEKINCDPGPFN